MQQHKRHGNSDVTMQALLCMLALGKILLLYLQLHCVTLSSNINEWLPLYGLFVCTHVLVHVHVYVHVVRIQLGGTILPIKVPL